MSLPSTETLHEILTSLVAPGHGAVPISVQARVIPLPTIEAARVLAEELSSEDLKQFNEFTGEARRAEWLAGRCSRATAKRDLLLQGARPEAIRLSLAHSGQVALCVGVAAPVAGLGVDLEPLERQVYPGLAKRISSREELALGLETLALWTVKEACLKAHYPASVGTVVAQYVIEHVRGSVGAAGGAGVRREGEVIGPEDSRYRFVLLEWGSYLVAIALKLG